METEWMMTSLPVMAPRMAHLLADWTLRPGGRAGQPGLILGSASTGLMRPFRPPWQRARAHCPRGPDERSGARAGAAEAVPRGAAMGPVPRSEEPRDAARVRGGRARRAAPLDPERGGGRLRARAGEPAGGRGGGRGRRDRAPAALRSRG